MLCIIRSSTARWSSLAASGILPGLLLRFLAACHRMTPPVTCLTRLRLDAILHDPPPQQHPSQQDRPRRGGARQPSLQDRLETPATRWTSLTRFWPDGTKKHLDLAAGTPLWYHPGQSTVPLRWVLLRDPASRRKTQALLSTDPDPAPSDHPLHLPAAQADGDRVPGGARPSGGPALAPVVGLGDCPYHTRPAEALQPAAHLLHRERPLTPHQSAWYVKTNPIFADVLVLVRGTLWIAGIPFSMSPPPPTSGICPQPPPVQILDTLCYTAWPSARTRAASVPAMPPATCRSCDGGPQPAVPEDHCQERHRRQAQADRLEQWVPAQGPVKIECDCPVGQATWLRTCIRSPAMPGNHRTSDQAESPLPHPTTVRFQPDNT